MKFRTDDTIAAIATPAGSGGIGVVRLSGSRALAIVEPLFRPAGGGSLEARGSHVMVYGWLFQRGEPIDEAMAVWMKAPRSYTREEVVEVHCHGGALVLRNVLEIFCGAGARLAEPGEFTMRAFLNGRIDLTRAEAVGEMVAARSQAGLRVAAHQLRGRLYEAVHGACEALRHVAALLAAGIDFPEEESVAVQREEIGAGLQDVSERVGALLRTAEQGRILREGLAVAIVGRSNVGKSSLLNALLKENRAIVTEIPGTTRDTVEESAEVGGVMLNLIDTAGIRDTADRVEAEGISRSLRALEQADLVLLVLDGTEPLAGDDETLLDRSAKETTLLVVNKRDLMERPSPTWQADLRTFPWLAVSALTGEGMTALGEWIGHWALRGETPRWEAGMITNLRQKKAAELALEALHDALAGLTAGVGEELLAVDVQRALDALGAIVGETTADDLLERIFSEFCIGK